MRSFLDTNVVVYAFDKADLAKQETAIRILESDERLVISTQVMLETWWTLTRKIATPLNETQASDVVDQLCRLPVVSADAELVVRAIQTGTRGRLAVWDALIIEAARTGGCQRVFSEDLQHGQDFGGVVVENPFRREGRSSRAE
jgi:predicted nucleic acid-binding protein